MSWYKNLLKRWTQIDCPRRPIKSFHFVHFASNCALSVPLCVLPLSLSLYSPTAQEQTQCFLAANSVLFQLSSHRQQQDQQLVGELHLSCQAANMVHTVSHTEPLQCSADGIWEACKHADEILPALMPDYFTKSVFLQGQGEPGSIRIVKMGPGMAN